MFSTKSRSFACTGSRPLRTTSNWCCTASATTDPYANQPGGYNVPNFRRIVTHTNPANPMEYLKLTINPNANAANGSSAFGPFSWARVKP